MMSFYQSENCVLIFCKTTFFLKISNIKFNTKKNRCFKFCLIDRNSLAKSWNRGIVSNIIHPFYIYKALCESVSVSPFVCPRGTNNLFVPQGSNISYTGEGGQTFLTHRREGGGQTFFTHRGGWDKHFMLEGGLPMMMLLKSWL